MALEYSLILSGNSSPEALLSRVFPEADGRPDLQQLPGGVWYVDLRRKMGFAIWLREGRLGYFDAEAGENLWTWELEHYLNLGFRFDKEFPHEEALRHLQIIVARVLATGAEDAALILNGNALRLLRKSGTLTRFSGGFWEAPGPLRNIQDVSSSSKA